MAARPLGGRRFIRRWRSTLLVVLGGVAGVALGLWWVVLGRTDPEPVMDDRTMFAYGSVGAEGKSLPLLVWQALPEICPADLPGGYRSIGFLYEPGRELPVGVSTSRLGVPRAAFNCAVCHTGSYRTAPDAPRQIVFGMPGHQMDLQRFTRFALRCITSPAFTADAVMAAISAHAGLGPLDRAIYRHILVPALRQQGRSLQEEFAWFDRRPDFGPGRFDGFAPYKDMRSDASIATADIMPVWNQRARGTLGRHWDGNTNSTLEGAIASALGFGATADTVRLSTLGRLSTWFQDLEPPAFPYPVEASLAERGRGVFDETCATCHGPGGARFGTVIPVAEIGSDPARHQAFTATTASALNALGAGYPWQLRSYRATNGYNASVLDGVWARAPYLHNGSVPSLADLLKPAAERPRIFYRGYDVYDPEAMGFVSAGAEAEREGFRYDVSAPGNGNQGHEYGVGLPEADKRALIEYLKTL